MTRAARSAYNAVPVSRFALLAVLAVLAAGCGGGGGEDDAAPRTAPTPSGGIGPGLTVEEALRSEVAGPVLVRGHVIAARNQPIRLCSALAESYPPQCGEPSLRVDELELEHLEGLTQSEDGAVTWSEREVKLIGILRDGSLFIEEAHR